MTLEEVKMRKQAISSIDETASPVLLLDKLTQITELFQDILKAIANGTCEDYIDCAKEVTRKDICNTISKL